MSALLAPSSRPISIIDSFASTIERVLVGAANLNPPSTSSAFQPLSSAPGIQLRFALPGLRPGPAWDLADAVLGVGYEFFRSQDPASLSR